MKRIVIIGATGSGKTTLGKNLAAKLGMPLTDLDDIHWQPNWQPRTTEDSRKMLDTISNAPGWIITGNYRKLQDVFWPRADTVIWLNYPFRIVFRQLLKRSIARILDQRPICNGNYETWRLLFSKESIMVWLFRSYWRLQHEYKDLFAHPERNPHLTFIKFNSPQEADAWLERL